LRREGTLLEEKIQPSMGVKAKIAIERSGVAKEILIL
jgi:hypothetical protein